MSLGISILEDYPVELADQLFAVIATHYGVPVETAHTIAGRWLGERAGAKTRSVVQFESLTLEERVDAVDLVVRGMSQAYRSQGFPGLTPSVRPDGSVRVEVATQVEMPEWSGDLMAGFLSTALAAPGESLATRIVNVQDQSLTVDVTEAAGCST